MGGVFDRGYRDAIDDAGRRPTSGPDIGFIDAFNAGFELTESQELLTSRTRNMAEKRAERRGQRSSKVARQVVCGFVVGKGARGGRSKLSCSKERECSVRSRRVQRSAA